METLLLRPANPTRFERKSKSLVEWLFKIHNRYAFLVAAKKYSCKHPFPPHTVVITAACGCETTVQACPCCGEHLTEPETDC